MATRVVIFSTNAGNQQYGLGQDAKLLELTLRELVATGKSKSITIEQRDPVKYIGDFYADVHIYLEVPCRAAFPFAKVNVIIPNPEWWLKDEWAWVKDEPTALFLHKTKHSQALFSNGFFTGWRFPAPLPSLTLEKKNQFLYVVGGSKNKMKAALQIADAWLSEYNPLIIVAKVAGPEKPNVIWKTGFLSFDVLTALQKESAYHIVASCGEGFGYTMAEALSIGARVLWTDIPVYKEIWAELLGDKGVIETTSNTDAETVMLDKSSTFTEAALHTAFLSVNDQKPETSISFINSYNKQFKKRFFEVWTKIMTRVKKTAPIVLLNPPVLPVVGVVTLVKNRPNWFINAVRNMEIADWPFTSLVWVIVDDGDSDKRVDRYLEKAQLRLPKLNIVYVSLPKPLSIGAKRNLGITRALQENSQVSVIAFMDDDDHYPSSSLQRRVSWLYSYNCSAVYCSTLPMYDTTHYISAMNVPPLDLSPRKRISEATLCFKISFWQAGGFPDISVAEGEGFLDGRELQSVEMPPTGVIVSFLHGKNFTSRRVPDTTVANGCHYGFSDEYFTMISQLGAV